LNWFNSSILVDFRSKPPTIHHRLFLFTSLNISDHTRNTANSIWQMCWRSAISRILSKVAIQVLVLIISTLIITQIRDKTTIPARDPNATRRGIIPVDWSPKLFISFSLGGLFNEQIDSWLEMLKPKFKLKLVSFIQILQFCDLLLQFFPIFDRSFNSELGNATTHASSDVKVVFHAI